MTKRYLTAGITRNGIAVLTNQGISAHKFPEFDMSEYVSDSPASNTVISS